MKAEHEQLNKRIHEHFFDGCFHEPDTNYVQGDARFPCTKCDQWIEAVSRQRLAYNPDYTTDGNACLRLVEAIRAKGYNIEIHGDPDGPFWDVYLGEGFKHEATADTLPMAITRACEKLIDGESK